MKKPMIVDATTSLVTARSYLFVPGDNTKMLSKAFERRADALIADLEDAVAPSQKTAARKIIASWMASLESTPGEVWVRVNNTDDLEGDIRGVFNPLLTGLMIPKIESPGEIERISALLDKLEEEAGQKAGQVRLLPIIETTAALLAVEFLARGPRVHQLMIGELDLGAELGVDPTDSLAFLPLRMQVVVASAAAGVNPPLGPVSPDFADLQSLRTETEVLARQGFGSRPAIHPAQVPIFNEVFTPSPDAAGRAQRQIDLYDAALAEGKGAVTDENGHMVDEAVVRVARRTLERARRAGDTS